MLLDESIRQVQAAVEQKFLFRKIGLPFDYASSPDDFPSKSFATAKEARANIPNPTGLGAGYHFSCRNHALLFDAYLLRIENGVEAPGDEAILDRLIGGLIRLATVAPKSFLIGGLAADGRGFFGQPLRENHAAWAFSVSRGLATAAISPESQEKFRSIAGKWIDRVKREKFRLNCIDGKPAPNGDISAPNPDCGPLLLAMLLVAAKASGEEKDYQLYAATADEQSRARLGTYSPDAGWDGNINELLWRQAAWSVIRDNEFDPERSEIAAQRLREHALAAARHAGAWLHWKNDLLNEPVDLNWRGCEKAPLGDSPYGFVPPPSWKRIEAERYVTEALSAAYTMLLAGDAALLEQQVPLIRECLENVPFDAMVTLAAVAPVIGIHARGVELGLWDAELFESRREAAASETSFAAKYLEPDYDDENPEKAGHAAPPPGNKREASRSESPAHKKRRRRKKRVGGN